MSLSPHIGGSFAGIAERSIFVLVSKTYTQLLPVSQTGGACSSGRPSYLVFLRISSFTLPSSVPVAVFVHAPLLISVPVSSTSSVAAPIPIVPPGRLIVPPRWLRP